MDLFYSNQNGEHCLYIDEGIRQQRVFLPPQIDELDAKMLVRSPTAHYVIQQILKEGEC